MRSFAVLPAAGSSRRMGRPKLVLPWGASTIIETVLDAWQASGVTKVVIAVRADDAELLEKCRSRSADVVVLEHETPDMKASVLAALRYAAKYAPAADEPWLLSPADTPTISANIIDRVLAEHRASQPAIVVPTFEGRRGHPVLLPWSVRSAIEGLKADEGINVLLAGAGVRLVELGERAVVEDIDTEAEYRASRP